MVPNLKLNYNKVCHTSSTRLLLRNVTKLQ